LTHGRTNWLRSNRARHPSDPTVPAEIRTTPALRPPAPPAPPSCNATIAMFSDAPFLITVDMRACEPGSAPHTLVAAASTGAAARVATRAGFLTREPGAPNSQSTRDAEASPAGGGGWAGARKLDWELRAFYSAQVEKLTWLKLPCDSHGLRLRPSNLPDLT